MKINVTIRETLTRKVEIEAGTKEEALRMVRKAYADGKIVLDWDDFTATEVLVD